MHRQPPSSSPCRADPSARSSCPARLVRSLLVGAVLFLGLGCGGLENEPLTRATVRGSLVGAGRTSLVYLFGQPAIHDSPTVSELESLARTPDAHWTFELTDVPAGGRELMILISPGRARRLPLELIAGEVRELPSQVGELVAILEADLDAPSHQRIRAGTVVVKGTNIERTVQESELDLQVPAGCYIVEAHVPGLGTKAAPEACVGPGLRKRVPLHFDQPDGTPDRTGCNQTGCVGDYRCDVATGRCVDDDDDDDDDEG